MQIGPNYCKFCRALNENCKPFFLPPGRYWCLCRAGALTRYNVNDTIKLWQQREQGASVRMWLILQSWLCLCKLLPPLRALSLFCLDSKIRKGLREIIILWLSVSVNPFQGVFYHSSIRWVKQSQPKNFVLFSDERILRGAQNSCFCFWWTKQSQSLKTKDLFQGPIKGKIKKGIFILFLCQAI